METANGVHVREVQDRVLRSPPFVMVVLRDVAKQPILIVSWWIQQSVTFIYGGFSGILGQTADQVVVFPWDRRLKPGSFILIRSLAFRLGQIYILVVPVTGGGRFKRK